MDQAVAAETVKEQRLMHWVKAHGDAILRTCFVYLSNLQDAEGAMPIIFPLDKPGRHLYTLGRQASTVRR